MCRNPRCCPPDGTPIADVPGAAAANAVLAGRVALPSRASLADRLKPVDADAAAETVAAIDVEQARLAKRSQEDDRGISEEPPPLADWPERRAWLDFVAELTCRYECAGPRLTPAEAGRLLVGLHDVLWRDACAEWSYDRPKVMEALWTDAVRHAPQGHLAAPATLLGLSAWLAGDGAYANVALDRALVDDPDYRLAQLIVAVIQAGVSPREFLRDRGAENRRSSRSGRAAARKRDSHPPRRPRARRRR
jgi:hypothetical protein